MNHIDLEKGLFERRMEEIKEGIKKQFQYAPFYERVEVIYVKIFPDDLLIDVWVNYDDGERDIFTYKVVHTTCVNDENENEKISQVRDIINYIIEGIDSALIESWKRKLYGGILGKLRKMICKVRGCEYDENKKIQENIRILKNGDIILRGYSSFYPAKELVIKEVKPSESCFSFSDFGEDVRERVKKIIPNYYSKNIQERRLLEVYYVFPFMYSFSVVFDVIGEDVCKEKFLFNGCI